MGRTLLVRLLQELGMRNKLWGVLACQLGSSYLQKAKLISLYVLLRLLRKVNVPILPASVRCVLRYKSTRFPFYIGSLDDYRVLEEMFVDKQYIFSFREGRRVIQAVLYNTSDASIIKTIVDVGSNVGASVRYFLAEFPSLEKVYAVEPTMGCFKVLEKTLGNVKKVELVRRAVTSKSGEVVTIYNHPVAHSGSSTSFIEGGAVEKVESISLDDLIEKNNIRLIDILKVDIEGGEFQAFSSFKSLDKVRYIFVEVHPSLTGKTVEDFLRLCPGFALIETTKNVYTSKTVILKLLNRKYLTYGNKVQEYPYGH